MKINWFLTISIIAFFCIGFIAGIFYTQAQIRTTAIGIADALDGNELNIEININETELVNKMNETFVPQFLEVMREKQESGE